VGLGPGTCDPALHAGTGGTDPDALAAFVVLAISQISGEPRQESAYVHSQGESICGKTRAIDRRISHEHAPGNIVRCSGDGPLHRGCVIADSPERGVVDSQHRVFGYKNMYICDGSVVAANLGVNPSLTITALAERAMSFVEPAENDIYSRTLENQERSTTEDTKEAN
jgi:choline dehydrogenase-like flavoprotein